MSAIDDPYRRDAAIGCRVIGAVDYSVLQTSTRTRRSAARKRYVIVSADGRIGTITLRRPDQGPRVRRGRSHPSAGLYLLGNSRLAERMSASLGVKQSTTAGQMTKRSSACRHTAIFSPRALFLQIVLACGLTGCAYTPDQSMRPPSDASIHELIETVSFDQVVDRVVRRASDVIVAKTDETISKKSLNASQMQIFSDGRREMIAAFDEELSWQRLEPDVVDCFKKFYTQRGVDALIGFYHSPTGAVILSRVPNAIMVVNQKNVDAWTKVRQTQGDDAYHERISHDLNAVLAPRDVDGFVAFYSSPIGREIQQSADQAESKFRQAIQARVFSAMERIRPIGVELSARVKAAQ